MRYLNGNYFAWQAKKRGRRLDGLSNPFLSDMLELKKFTETWDKFFDNSVEERDAAWDELDIMWTPLRQKYSWAVPDQRALNILKEFSPLVEIGAGNGYWAAMLLRMGVRIMSFDVKVSAKNSWSKVRRGGPEVLKLKILKGVNLFLCYPDEQESIAIVCLENFTGEYIIHVGELAMSGTVGGIPQAPFGRTSSAEFQIALQANFHCLLVAELDMKLPYGKDCISVWKRTNYVRGRVTRSASSVKPKYVNCDCCPESEGGKPRPKEEVLAIENGEEEEKKGEMEDAIQPPSPTTDAASDAVSYMSLSDLALLRGTSSDAAPALAAAAAVDNADAVSYMSLSDLALLRGASTSGAENDDQQLPDKKKAKQSSTVSSEDHSHHDNGHDHATHAPLPLTAISTDALVVKDENAKGTGDSGDCLAFMKAEEIEESAKAQRNSLRISGRKRIRASKEPVHTHDHTHAHIKKEEEEEESEEEALHRQREEDLSGQYEESNDKLWAHIPLDEILPVDRAAPCLAHLLAAYPAGGRTVISY